MYEFREMWGKFSVRIVTYVKLYKMGVMAMPL
jgi:hypothetical protein